MKFKSIYQNKPSELKLFKRENDVFVDAFILSNNNTAII